MSTPTGPTLSPPSSIRKKRNFKALQLPTPGVSSASSIDPDNNPIATRDAPPPLPGLAGINKRSLAIDTVQNVHNSGLGPHAFGRGALAGANGSGAANGNGLGPISASALLTPESSTTQRRNLQMTLTTTLEQFDQAKGGKSSADLADTEGSSTPRKVQRIDGPLKQEDLKNIAELGMGNGGSVMKVEHVPSGIIMAKKIVLIDAKPSVRKQILRELHIMHSCDSPYIVSSFGAFLYDPNICICMEFMDKGSFDSIYKRTGAIPIDIVGSVALSVLEGLVYLYGVHHIIHRDIKPSNILLNGEGEIKLCDFGVSGELINSIANTFVGTSVYMSPERIQGSDYSVKSDVWSLGITLIELAHGHFPFSDSYSDDEEDDFPRSSSPSTPVPSAAPSASLSPSDALSPASRSRHSRRKSKGVSLHGGAMTLSILELMHHIVREPAPRLTSTSSGDGKAFPAEADTFVDACLVKEWEGRKMPKELLEFRWVEDIRERKVDVRAWAGGV